MSDTTAGAAGERTGVLLIRSAGRVIIAFSRRIAE
jgi:hypothetical protein